MAWSDLTITRADLDALEGQTFERYDSGTDLGLGNHDDDKLTEAKNQLADDIIVRYDDADFTETALLDSLEDADDRDLLKRALTYKFLSIWFLDDTSAQDSLTFRKAGLYEGKYKSAVGIAVKNARSKLSTPKNNKQFKLTRVW